MRVLSDTDGDGVVYDTGFIASTSGRTHTYSPGAYTGVDTVIGDLRVSQALQYGKHYHWHVRYRDSAGVWSAWRADTPGGHQDFYTVQTGTFVIYSDQGSGNPVAGVYNWTSGQMMPAGRVTSPTAASAGKRWRCTGYTGTGSAPSGSGTSCPAFIITQDSTLRWNWVAQYQVSPSDGPNGSISPSSASWQDAGSDLTFTATPSGGYLVDRWIVNGVNVQYGGGAFLIKNLGHPA